MLKAKVGYSINPDDFISGMETAKKSTKDFSNIKINLLYTSSNMDVKKVVKGIRDVTDTPIIGCTSNGGVIVPDGYVTSEQGFSGMMSLNDPDLEVGVSCHEAGKDPRVIGRKVAIEAVQNAKTTRAPSYFYMVASPKEEEKYLMGIQDVIGRVPMFGGSAADENVDGNWKIICNDKVISDGVAVAFFYTDCEIITKFDGMYNETDNMGLITEVKDNRELVTIDHVSALKKYANWTNSNPLELKDKNLLFASVRKPLGIKDPLGNITIIRHPMYGNDLGTKKISDDTITLGNDIIEKTAIVQMEATDDELVNGPLLMLKKLKSELYSDPAAYVLIHDGARRIILKDRIEEVTKQIVKETKGVPFIMPFTFGEYGYDDHSANICGGLMLSFTVFGKD